jgi:hypothetical protein
MRDCEGFEVRSSEGVKLGKVARSDAEELVVRSGFISVKEFLVPLSEVGSMTSGEVYLRHTAAFYTDDALPPPREHENQGRDGDEIARARLMPLSPAAMEERFLAGRDELRPDAEEPVLPRPEDEPLH